MLLYTSHRWRAAARVLARGGRLLLLAGTLGAAARGDVIVLANRTGGQLPVQFAPAAGRAQRIVLSVGESVPLFVDGRAQVEFATGAGAKRYQLDPNCAYFFARIAGGRIEMQRIGLGEDDRAAQPRLLPGSATSVQTATIQVRILVDEEEPARQAYWERRLRRRVESASAILEKHSGVALRVVAVGTWESDNGTTDFIASLGEFEREATPFPARVAIGFTSQWTMVRGRTHMAGTRGPLHSHILVREGSPEISEPEKLEFLVHELGHHLGATHSPERDSVMRPVLGDNLAGRSDFRIQFDPVNTLTIAMVGEELRRRNITRFTELTPGTQQRLRQIYTQMAGATPNDPTGNRYVQLVSPGAAIAASSAQAAAPSLPSAAKHVLQAIVRAAHSKGTLEGDALTEHYVRHAAQAASSLPESVAARAFCIALGIGLDDSDLLMKLPGGGTLLQQVENPHERSARLAVLSAPTLRGRRDLAQHFFVSACLAASLGPAAANAAGIAKEFFDADGGSGFSFVDLAADRAGVRFADAVTNKRILLAPLGRSFSVANFMPEIHGLPESLAAADLASQFGAKDDDRFRHQLQEIDRRINQLPAYRTIHFNFGR